jgi:hypothetical protein
MKRRTHTILFGLALLSVIVLFTILVAREILVRVGYDANTLDPLLETIFLVIAFPTFICVIVSAAPQFLADVFLNDTHPTPKFLPKRQPADIARAKENIRALGLLIEDAEEGEAAPNPSRQSGRKSATKKDAAP